MVSNAFWMSIKQRYICFPLRYAFSAMSLSISARSSRSLCSADRGLLRVPFALTSTRQKRAFAVGAPQFGMASLCRYAHSLERFLRHSFLNLRRFYLVVLGLGAPLSNPT